MKRDKYSTEEWLTLIERYYDALTTPQEEELLKKFLAAPEADAPCFDEIKATLAYFAVSKQTHKKKRSTTRLLTRSVAAAAAIIIAIASVWQTNSDQDICVAYINGRIVTDEAIVMQQMHSAMALISQTTSENSIEKQLSEMFNITDTQEE
jgi:hypothetical protein